MGCIPSTQTSANKYVCSERTVRKNGALVIGHNNLVVGDGCTVYGNGNTVIGNGCIVFGHQNKVDGDDTQVSGHRNLCIGLHVMVKAGEGNKVKEKGCRLSRSASSSGSRSGSRSSNTKTPKGASREDSFFVSTL